MQTPTELYNEFALVSDAYGSDPIPTGSRRGQVSGSFFHVIATDP